MILIINLCDMIMMVILLCNKWFCRDCFHTGYLIEFFISCEGESIDESLILLIDFMSVFWWEILCLIGN